MPAPTTFHILREDGTSTELKQIRQGILMDFHGQPTYVNVYKGDGLTIIEPLKTMKLETADSIVHMPLTGVKEEKKK